MFLPFQCRACLPLFTVALWFASSLAVRADEADALARLLERVQALAAAENYRDAIPLAQQLVTRAEKAFRNDPESLATCLNALAWLYYSQGRYADAEPLYLRGVKLNERALGADHTDVADNLNNLALLYGDQNRYDEAEPLYLRALKIYEATYGPDHEELAVSLNNLGLLYGDQGRYAEAEPLHLRALKIRERALGGAHAEVAASLNNLALLYYEQGRFAEAEPPYLRALKINEVSFGADHPEVATSLSNLALVYDELDRFAEAEPLHLRALKIRENALGGEHADVASSLNNLALAYASQGRYADAEPLYLRALKINEQAVGADHPNVAVVLHNLAESYKDQGRYADAEPLIERTVRIADMSGAAPGRCFRAHYLHSEIAWELGKKDDALRSLEQAITLAEAQRTQASGGERERAQLFAGFSGAYERMVKWQRERGDATAAFAALERSRARALLDQIAGNRVELLSGVPEAEARRLKADEAAAQRRAAELEKQIELARRSREPVEALEKEFFAARGEVAAAFAAIRNAGPAYRQMVGRDFKPAGLPEVQDRIAGDDKLVLEYLLGDEAGYVFVVPPNKQSPRIEMLTLNEEQAELLGAKAGPLTKDVLRKIFNRGDRDGVLDLLRDQFESAAAIKKLHALWQVLIPEAERKALAGGELKQLIVIPDGALAMLPFDALVVRHDDKLEYLLDVGPPIVGAASATLLLNLMDAVRVPGPKGRKPVLSVGDPAYDAAEPRPGSRGAADLVSVASRYTSARGLLQRLPFSGQEVDWIADVFSEQGVLVGKLLGGEATEQAVRFNLPGRKIVHLACHGLADQSYGNLFGALAFVPGSAGADDPADDGFLTLAEIYGLDLKGCELTILSACDTNVGPEQKGEGTWALSRGFLVAGSRRVVASNWLVDDEAAASLMSYFCATIAAGEKSGTVDHAAALQAAKRWVRSQGRWETPYYWGTFALIGPQ